MTASSVIMGINGIVLSFMPHETLSYFGSDQSGMNPLILQLMGALYFAFAMVNWTAKANLIGGIYGRPIAIGNLAHFMIGALALSKSYLSSHNSRMLLPSLLYIIFGVLFGIVFFRHPIKKED